MRKIYKVLMLFLLLIMIFTMKNVTFGKEYISAQSYCLVESTTKRVIEGKNINERFLTASICKVLTAIIIIENVNIEDYVIVTKETINQEGSSIYLKENDMLQVKDLLYGLLLRSGNDCAYLLATYLTPNINDFSKLMNKYAKIIGMKNSTFSNPSGLDDENYNYSTAYDMSLLMIYAMKNSTFREIVGSNRYYTTSVNNEKYYFFNKHKLVQKYDYIIGGKTGYTEKAGRTLITYSSKNDMELCCVTFKSNNDWNEHINLINGCYDNYYMKEVMKKQIIVTKSDYMFTPYLDENIILPIKRNEKINIKILLLNKLYKESKEVGKIEFYSNNEKIFEKILYRYY